MRTVMPRALPARSLLASNGGSRALTGLVAPQFGIRRYRDGNPSSEGAVGVPGTGAVFGWMRRGHAEDRGPGRW